MRVLGIMSGTSLDGVDFGLCQVARGRIELLELWSRSFPAGLQRRLRNAAADAASSHELAQLHHDLGRFYARHAGGGKQAPELIGLHGQTVFHKPSKTRPASLQIGEPAHLCEAMRCPVVSNFRAGDLAAGGQGAPLATAFHSVAFALPGKSVAVNNLGGISNVSWFPTQARRQVDAATLSFDTGPGSMLIDQAMRMLTKRRMDRNGRYAARGRVNDAVLSRWLRHPFFRAKPPKSTGREVFGEVFLERALRELKGESTEDIVATLTELTARSVALNYERYLGRRPDRVVLCGGGAANRTLVARIRALLGDETELLTSADLGWPLQAVEPAAFAWLAWLRWKRKSWPHPATTGAKRAALLGQVTEP
ncbi:MAG: anhydro-N-acetylmuramic acid kinase [Limisphaerales bacterium]